MTVLRYNSYNQSCLLSTTGGVGGVHYVGFQIHSNTLSILYTVAADVVQCAWGRAQCCCARIKIDRI